MLEQTIQNRARLALSQEQLGVYWRANVGQAWASNEVYKISGPAHAQSFTLFTGDMVLRGARPFDTGLPKGFSDLFGITPVTITPEMVGKSLGVFTGLEAKGPNGRLSKHQEFFLEAVQRNGGIAGLFRSPEQAVALVKAGSGK